MQFQVTEIEFDFTDDIGNCEQSYTVIWAPDFTQV